MLVDLLKSVAPGLATLVTGPVAGMAIKAIADKLGVPADEMSITEAIKADPEAALKLREIDVRELEAHNANTDSARKMNAAIQESSNASWLAKNVAYVLDSVIVGATLLLTYLLFFKGVPEANKELAYSAFGSLITLCGTVVNFHRGSSQGSKDKAAEIQALKGSK
jgi:hypothetical protein